MRRFTCLSILLALGFAGGAPANNLVVTNVALEAIRGNKAKVSFDISWDNSWRDSINCDAAWVFVKYSIDSGSTWRHATLAASGTNPVDFARGTNSAVEIYVPADKKGGFVQRATEGTGTLASAGVTFIWDLDADGVSKTNNGRVKVTGIEMALVSEGSFYVGDDFSRACQFFVTVINTNNINAATATGGSGTLANPYVNPDGIGRPGDITGTFSNSYPNGYGAFYCMKYELARGQYLDFLNSIPYEAATNLLTDTAGVFPSKPVGRSNTINGTHPNYTNAAPCLPWAFNLSDGESGSNGGGLSRLMAYLDWAALRPMTEMEFEKACRGPVQPIDGDFAWGTPGEVALTNTTGLLDALTASETPRDPNVNCHTAVGASTSGGGGVAGPLRCGAFAGTDTDQFQAGASYYGIMELSGSCYEWTIDTGRSANRNGTPDTEALNFGGSQGDGEVDPATGLHDVSDWPQNYTTCAGAGLRGGSCGHEPMMATVASRIYAAYAYPYGGSLGGRGVRSR